MARFWTCGRTICVLRCAEVNDAARHRMYASCFNHSCFHGCRRSIACACRRHSAALRVFSLQERASMLESLNTELNEKNSALESRVLQLERQVISSACTQ